MRDSGVLEGADCDCVHHSLLRVASFSIRPGVTAMALEEGKRYRGIGDNEVYYGSNPEYAPEAVLDL